MKRLKEEESPFYTPQANEFHVIRHSYRFWAGLSSDLAIEQVLMRSLKTTGGLTRGRGMLEVLKLVWLLSIPVTAEIVSFAALAMEAKSSIFLNSRIICILWEEEMRKSNCSL